jgi:hypothetical protein
MPSRAGVLVLACFDLGDDTLAEIPVDGRCDP